jgi:hypothetical protein
VRPVDLTVFRTGDFEICFEDGYWIAVSHRADTTPVRAYVDC